MVCDLWFVCGLWPIVLFDCSAMVFCGTVDCLWNRVCVVLDFERVCVLVTRFLIACDDTVFVVMFVMKCFSDFAVMCMLVIRKLLVVFLIILCPFVLVIFDLFIKVAILNLDRKFILFNWD